MWTEKHFLGSGLVWDADESGLGLGRKLAREGQVGERVIGVRRHLGRTWKGMKTLGRTRGVPMAEKASHSLSFHAVPHVPHSPLVARATRRVRRN